MIAGISSASSELFGALLAVANPRVLNGAQSTQDANKLSKTSAVDPTAALGGKSELTAEEQEQVEELKQRDAEVRRHESAHKAAAGSYARGGPSFEYQTGPDGKRYAVGGEVSIDTSAISGDPQATLRKMQQIRRAASAPAEPSAKDRQIAAQAAQVETQARAELAQQKREEAAGSTTQADAASAPKHSDTTAVQPIPNPGGKVATPAPFLTDTPKTPGRFIDVRA